MPGEDGGIISSSRAARWNPGENRETEMAGAYSEEAC